MLIVNKAYDLKKLTSQMMKARNNCRQRKPSISHQSSGAHQCGACLLYSMRYHLESSSDFPHIPARDNWSTSVPESQMHEPGFHISDNNPGRTESDCRCM